MARKNRNNDYDVTVLETPPPDLEMAPPAPELSMPTMPINRDVMRPAPMAAPSVQAPANPELERVKAALAALESEQGPSGWRGALASGLRGLSYGGMDPAQAMQLERQREAMEFAQKRTKTQDLVARVKAIQDQERQATMDARQNVQDVRAGIAFDQEQQQNAAIFPIQQATAQAQLDKMRAPAHRKFGSRDVVRDGRNFREYFDEQDPGVATDTIDLGPLEQDRDPKIGTTLETAKGIMQWNPETQRYDIPAGQKPMSAGSQDQDWVIRNGQLTPIRKGTAQPGDKPYDAVAARQDGSQDGASPYSAERAARTVQSVDELMGKVNGWTAGFGSLLGVVPETEARNFKAELDTLKANIAFNELTQMREASKTGGALGQVSNIELGLLQSALGALDVGQSPQNLKEQLGKIKASVERWQEARAKHGMADPTPPPNGGRMTATNPKTGERIESLDGGKTWRKLP